jgi:hypothetical protein
MDREPPSEMIAWVVRLKGKMSALDPGAIDGVVNKPGTIKERYFVGIAEACHRVVQAAG